MADEPFLQRPAIEAAQLARLRALFDALFAGNEFYRRKLWSAGVTSAMDSLNDFAARCPFTTKQELAEDQRAHPPFGTNLTFPLDHYTRFHQTSGTSGAPLRWLDTPESWDWMVANWCEIYKAAGVRKAERVFFAFSFGPFIGFWLAYEAANRIGCLCLPGGGLSSLARLRVLLDNGANVLCCTPTYAMRLAEVAASERIDLGASQIRTIIVAGEPGGSIPSTRERLQKLWPGARIFDHHGMTEIGPVTFECPAQPGVLHVLESGYFAEVIDSTSSRPVGPGEQGELVLTNLGRIGSPLLRYRTGDVVKCGVRSADCGAEGPCRCGRYDLALEGGILGRVDDMVVVRGVNVYPSAVEEIVRACGGVAEYRVLVHEGPALTELKVEIEPSDDCRDVPDLLKLLEKAFLRAFALRVPVSSVSPGTLPRFEMKASRWVRSKPNVSRPV